MWIRNLVANGVATIKNIVDDGGLLVEVSIQAWKGDDGFGGDDLADAVTYKALYIQRQKFVKSMTGDDVLATSYLLILEPIAATVANTGVTRRNPLDPRDVITLPDEVVGKILAIEGLVDSETIAPFYGEIWLG